MLLINLAEKIFSIYRTIAVIKYKASLKPNIYFSYIDKVKQFSEMPVRYKLRIKTSIYKVNF